MPAPHIAVIGLGAMGAAALHHLARRGVRATGIEQFEIGHARGSSHGATRIFRLAHFENAAYVPLLRRACELWRELERESGQDLLVNTGIIEIGPPDGALVRGTLAAASLHALPHELLDAKALTRRYPQFRPPSDYVGVFQPDGGYLEAARALRATASLAERAGAIVRTGEKVLAVAPGEGGLRIATDRAEFEADGAIVTAGPWMHAVLPDLALPLRVTRQAIGWFEPFQAENFSAPHFPVFLLESPHGMHYGLPAYGDMGVKIARHHHRNQTVTADDYDGAFSAADEAAIRGPLAEYLPGCGGRLLAGETCLYTMTPDATFIIDRTPQDPRVLVASPCCGHGFKFSPVVGEILADLVIHDATEHDISPFRLDRFGAVAKP